MRQDKVSDSKPLDLFEAVKDPNAIGSDAETQPTGVELIAEERQHQIEAGHSAGNDDSLTDGALALMAACYASPVRLYRRIEDDDESISFTDPWPASCSLKHDRRRSRGGVIEDIDFDHDHEDYVDRLVEAGALIAAEIDRVSRVIESEKPENNNDPDPRFEDPRYNADDYDDIPF
jgi:hypothetical protein